MAQLLENTLAPGPTERYDLDADPQSLALLQRLQAGYGDVCRVPSRTRGNDGLVVHDADAIHRVLLANRANYVKGAGLERVRMLLGNGLILSDGETWARQRRLMQPAFQGRALREHAPMMERVHDALIARWSRAAEDGAAIDLTRELSEVTLAIVLQALFGADLDRLVEAEGRNPFDLLTEETRRDLPFAARFRALTRFVRAMIERRRREGPGEADFLAMLMQARDCESGAGMTDRELLDEAMTLIVAGHETTASTLNWTWYLLDRHPDVEAQVQTATASTLEQVLQEALRLYPPVWLFSRRALADDRLGGFHVPAGTDVFVCPYLLHRHPAHWQRPEAFEPERFAPAAAAGRHRFAYLPFAAGPRFCIGAGFAMNEMVLHLTRVARRFRLRQLPDAASPEADFQINLRTREALHMRVVAR